MTAERTVKTYDFKRPDKFSLEQIRTIAIIHETFARHVSTQLSSSLRLAVDVDLRSVDQLTFAEFVASIPDPCGIAIMTMKPLRGNGLIALDPSLVFSFFDRLFGGAGDSASIDRSLTDLEGSVFGTLISKLLAGYAEAWSPVIDLDPGVGAVETEPRFAQVVPPMEMCTLVSFEVRSGETKGYMNVCLPYITVEPIIPRLSLAFSYAEAARRSQAEWVDVSNIPVATDLVLDARALSLRDLGALKVGDLVPLKGDWLDRSAVLRSGGERVIELRCDPPVRRFGGAKLRAEDVYGPYRVARAPQGPIPVKEARDGPDQLRTLKDEILAEVKAVIRSQSTDVEALEPLGPPHAGFTAPFGFVAPEDTELVAEFMKGELHQTVAMVLSSLEPAIAAGVLGAMEESAQPDIIRRVAQMGTVAPAVLREVAEVLQARLLRSPSKDAPRGGGIETAVGILNLVNRNVEKRVIEALEVEDAELSESIKERMFVFEDIVLLTFESLQVVVATADRHDLLVSLKAVGEEVRQLVIDAMEAAERPEFLEEFGALERMPLSLVEAAQLRVIQTIRDLEEEGRLFVARPETLV